MDLVTFLLARITEQEQGARSAGSGHWRAPCYCGRRDPKPRSHDLCTRVEGHDITIYDEGGHSPEQAQHIAHWDPNRVLAECEARRRVIEALVRCVDVRWTGTSWAVVEEARAALLALTLPDHQHPDYHPEWAIGAAQWSS